MIGMRKGGGGLSYATVVRTSLTRVALLAGSITGRIALNLSWFINLPPQLRPKNRECGREQTCARVNKTSAFSILVHGWRPLITVGLQVLILPDHLLHQRSSAFLATFAPVPPRNA